MMFYVYIYNNKKKTAGPHVGLPGLKGHGLTLWDDRVSPDQIPGGFFLKPGPVPAPGQPGSGSIRRAGPGFKTMCV
jgi:hypothetical protein